MSYDNLWRTALDGVTYLELNGFIYSYYIYPSDYLEEPLNNKYELRLIKEDNTFNRHDIRQFDTLEEAKAYAIADLKSIIQPLLDII